MSGDVTFTYRQVVEAAQTLGLGESATLGDIKKAYKDLARTYHPDAGEETADPEQFLRISFAYNVLLEYARLYRIEFTEEAYLKRYPEEKIRRQFYSDPIWGPGRSDRDREPQ